MAVRRRLAALPVAVPLVLLAVLLTGCGSSGTASTPEQLVSAVSAKTSASNAKVALSSSVAAAGRTVPINGTGAFDFAARRGTITIALAQGGTRELRLIGDVIYEKLPQQLATQTGGKQWLKIDLNALSTSAGGRQLGSLSQSSDPSQVLKYLQGSSAAVSTVGKEDVRGTPSTHYRTQVELAKAVKRGAFGQSTADAFVKQFGTGTFPVDVWIDKQGRAGRTSYSLKPLSGVGSFTFTQELYDFGNAGVGELTSPPIGQTQDISQLVNR